MVLGFFRSFLMKFNWNALWWKMLFMSEARMCHWGEHRFLFNFPQKNQGVYYVLKRKKCWNSYLPFTPCACTNRSTCQQVFLPQSLEHWSKIMNTPPKTNVMSEFYRNRLLVICPEANNDFSLAARKRRSLMPQLKLRCTQKTRQVKGLMKMISLLSHQQKINR